MPILFKTSHRCSAISGMGIFADQDIPKGTVWWTMNPQVKGIDCLNTVNLPNIILGQEDQEDFCKGKNFEEMSQILEHTMYYTDGDKLVIFRDGSGCVNHSFEPNSQIVFNKEKDVNKLYSITLKDIKAGEEIVENYGNYCKKSNNWSEEFLRKYTPERLEFEAKFEIKKVEN